MSAVVLDPAELWVPGGFPRRRMHGRRPAEAVRSQARPLAPSALRVALPASWNGRAIQMGGARMNRELSRADRGFEGRSDLKGFAVRQRFRHSDGDDSRAPQRQPSRPRVMQMKKTHDVAMVLIEGAPTDGARPTTISRRLAGRPRGTDRRQHPQDYDGVLSTGPIVGFFILMLRAPTPGFRNAS